MLLNTIDDNDMSFFNFIYQNIQINNLKLWVKLFHFIINSLNQYLIQCSRMLLFLKSLRLSKAIVNQFTQRKSHL